MFVFSGLAELAGIEGIVGAFLAGLAAQAATLAAILVGVRIGLSDERTLNAVVGVFAVTCLLSSWLAGRYASRLPHPAAKRDLGATVIVPVARPTRGHTCRHCRPRTPR